MNTEHWTLQCSLGRRLSSQCSQGHHGAMAGCSSYTGAVYLGAAVCSVNCCSVQCAVCSAQWLVCSVQGWQVILSAPQAERLPPKENTEWNLLQHKLIQTIQQNWSVRATKHKLCLTRPSWVFATTHWYSCILYTEVGHQTSHTEGGSLARLKKNKKKILQYRTIT